MLKIRVNPIFNNNHNFRWLDDVVRAKQSQWVAFSHSNGVLWATQIYATNENICRKSGTTEHWCYSYFFARFDFNIARAKVENEKGNHKNEWVWLCFTLLSFARITIMNSSERKMQFSIYPPIEGNFFLAQESAVRPTQEDRKRKGKGKTERLIQLTEKWK